MKKRILSITIMLFYIFLSCNIVKASYADERWQWTSAGVQQERCTYRVWHEAYDRLGISLPTNWGNAASWASNARNQGVYSVDNTPTANSIVCWGGGTDGWGHVAYVTGVDSTYVYIREGGINPSNSYPAYWYRDTSYLRSNQNRWSGYSLNGYIHLNANDSVNEIDVRPGIYTIHSAWNDNQVLDIQYDSMDNSANIQLYHNINSDVQKFRIIKYGDYYCIQSVYSGKWLDIALPIQARANVQLWNNNESEEEKWIFEDAGNGYVNIRSLTGYYLDLAGDSYDDNANVQVYPYPVNNSQKWRLEDCASPINVRPGIYTIHSAWDDNQVLDIQYDSMDNSANIQLYHNINSDVQKFRIIKYGDYYCIQSVYSGKWLDIALPIQARANVQLWNNNESEEEKWVFEDAGNGYVNIRSLTGYYLDLAGDSCADNANVQVYPYPVNNSQKWKLEDCTNYADVQPGIYTIHSAWDDNQVLDIQYDSMDNSANIQLYHNINSDVQKFKIIKYGDYYCIQSIYSGKWLDITLPIQARANVQLWYSNESEEEKWIFEDAGNGYVNIRSLTGYYLDLAGDSCADNANVQVYPYVANNSQKWRLEKCADNAPTTETIITNHSSYSLINTTVKNTDNGAQVIFAVYKNKKLVDLQIRQYEGVDIEITTIPDYEEIKVMLWSNIKNMKPLCPPSVFEKKK